MSKKHYIIPIFVPHEGCPHNCVFCNQDAITGNHEVVDENYAENIIKTYLDTIDRSNDPVVEVSFFGGTFTAIDIDKQRRLLSVAKKYKDMGAINYIRMSTRPDYIDEEILEHLVSFNVDIIELGVQSLNESVLLKSGRGHSVEQVERASKLIKEYGITLGHQIMVGLPGDSFLRDIETLKKVIEMKPSICRIYPSLVVKNTPMEKMYNDGVYKPYSLQEAVEISKVLYSMLTCNDINVIRIGLQPTEDINIGKDLVAGPFHPAFRELVESSLLNDLIVDYVSDKSYENITLEVNPKDISKLYANKKEFFYDTVKKLKTNNINVIQNNLIPLNEIAISIDNVRETLSINNYILSRYKEGYFKNL